MQYPPGMIDGDPHAPILVVAMAPGSEELVEGRPLVGPSGKLFWSCAARAGFSRADCYIINTIGEIQEDGSSPSEEQFNKYWDLFDLAIRDSRATVAICLGGDAFWRLTGIKGGILDWRGYVVEASDCLMGGATLVRVRTGTVPYKTSGKGHKKGDPRPIKIKTQQVPHLSPHLQYIFPTIHPSFVMRTGWKATPVLAYDVARAKRALDGELRFSDLTYEITPFPMGESHEPVAFDIETSGSLVGQAWINRIGLSSRAGTWTAPWNHTTKESAREYLEDPNRLKIGHNVVAFDVPKLKAAGVNVVGPFYDTMYACQILQPDLPKGLNYVASLYLDSKRWKHRSEEEPERYNAVDVAQTRFLYEVTKEAITETGQMPVFNTMMEALPVLMRLSTKGMRLDPEKRKAWSEKLSVQENILFRQWVAHHPACSISSNVQLKNLFYNQLGYRVQVGDDGKPTTDETAIMKLHSLYPEDTSIPVLLAWRKVNTLRKNYAEVKLWDDGCVHPSYTATAKDKDERGKGMAGTGRILPRDPNMAQVPKEGRKIYIPHNPSNVILELDYVQAELRVVAAISRDAMLMERINGPDVHQVHADMWGCSRKEAKNVTYATMYGAGKEKLQAMFTKYGIKKTQKECEILLSKFYSTYPTVKAWRESIISAVSTDRQVRNPFGRVRHFWNPKKDVPAALDYIPQSTVADIMWSSLVEVEKLFEANGGCLLTLVYDSYVGEVHKLRAKQAALAISEHLQRTYDNIAPGFFLPVTYRWGQSWGELEGDICEEKAEAEETLLA